MFNHTIQKTLHTCDVRHCQIVEETCTGTGKVRILMLQDKKLYLQLLFRENFYSILSKGAPTDFGEAELYYIENRRNFDNSILQ